MPRYAVLGCLVGAFLMDLGGISSSQVQDHDGERQQVQVEPSPIPAPQDEADDHEVHERTEGTDQGDDEGADDKTFWQWSTVEAFWQWATSDPVAFFTLWLAVFTSILAVSTIGLWFVTWRGGRRQSAETRILQRAYLSVEPKGIRPRTEAHTCVAQIVIRNNGHLPARNVRWLIKWSFSDLDDLDDLPLSDGAVHGNITLPPGGDMRHGAEHIINVKDASTVRDGHYIYVWGAVFYEDGFGTERTTRYCHRYNCVNFETRYTPVRGDVSIIIGRLLRSKFARYHVHGNDAT